MTENEESIKNRLISFEESLVKFFDSGELDVVLARYDYICYDLGLLKEIMDNLNKIIK